MQLFKKRKGNRIKTTDYKFLNMFEDFSIRNTWDKKKVFMRFSIKVNDITVERTLEGRTFETVLEKARVWVEKNKKQVEYLEKQLRIKNI